MHDHIRVHMQMQGKVHSVYRDKNVHLGTEDRSVHIVLLSLILQTEICTTTIQSECKPFMIIVFFFVSFRNSCKYPEGQNPAYFLFQFFHF